MGVWGEGGEGGAAILLDDLKDAQENARQMQRFRMTPQQREHREKMWSAVLRWGGSAGGDGYSPTSLAGCRDGY